MENDNFNQGALEQIQSNSSSLRKATPLSKYLAMALFIILPFLGGWIGYTYSPEKVVEVEKIIYKDSELSNTGSQNLVHQDTDKSLEEIAFVSYNESGWKGGWMVRKNSNTGEWEDIKQVAGKYIQKRGVLKNNHVFLSTYGDLSNNPDYSSYVTIVSLENNEVSQLPVDGYLVNLLEVENSVFAFVINNWECMNIPGRMVYANSDSRFCIGKIIDITPDGLSSTAFPELPGAKKLVAYDPATQTMILSDGYGAGCVTETFYTYDLVRKTIVESESFSYCDEFYEGVTSYASYKEDFAVFKQTVVNKYLYHIYDEENLTQSFSFANSQVESVSKEITHPEALWVTEIPLN